MNIVPRMSGAPLADDRALLDALRDSDLMRKAAESRAASVLAFRTAAARKLAELEAAAEKAFPKLRGAREAAIKAAQEAERTWREACGRVHGAQTELSSASARYTTDLQAFESQLIETCSPEIALFIAELDAEWDKAARAVAYTVQNEANAITGARRDRTFSNVASINVRRAAIREAQDIARAMRLDPEQSTISARLHQLRANLPAIADL